MTTVSRTQPSRNPSNLSSFIPNSFHTPNIIVDELLPLLSHTEYILLSWMIRHILGWHDNINHLGANLSLTTFLNGYRGYKGCGLAKATIVKALAALEQHKIIASEDGGQLGTFYRLTYDLVDWDSLVERERAWSEMQMTLRVEAMNQAKCGVAIEETSGTSHVPPEETGSSCHELPPSREGGSCHEPIKIQEEKDITYVPQAGEPEGADPSSFQWLIPETGGAFEEEKDVAPLIPDLVYEDLTKPTRKSKRTDTKASKPIRASQTEVKQPRKDAGINSIIGAYIKSTGVVIANPYGDTAIRAVARALDNAGITSVDVSTYVAEKIDSDPFWRGKTVTLKFIGMGIARWKEDKQELVEEKPDEEYVAISPEEEAEFDALLDY